MRRAVLTPGTELLVAVGVAIPLVSTGLSSGQSFSAAFNCLILPFPLSPAFSIALSFSPTATPSLPSASVFCFLVSSCFSLSCISPFLVSLSFFLTTYCALSLILSLSSSLPLPQEICLGFFLLLCWAFFFLDCNSFHLPTYPLILLLSYS